MSYPGSIPRLVSRVGTLALLSLALLCGSLDAQARGILATGDENTIVDTKSPFVMFVTELEAAVSRGDVAWVDQHIDRDGLAQVITLGYEDAGPQVAELRHQLDTHLDWGKSIVDAVQRQAGMYHLLWVRQDGARVTSLFRLNTRSGLNYHELELITNARGEVRIRNIYVHGAGIWMSQTVRHNFVVALSKQRPDIELRPDDALYVQHLTQLETLQELTQADKHQEALDLIATLPEELQAEKYVQLARAVNAVRLGGTVRDTAAADFARDYPGDPGFDLILAEAARETGKADGSFAAIGRIDKALGGDPYLDVLRAVILVRQAQYGSASNYASRAIKQEPNLAEAHLLLVAAQLAQGNFAATAEAMQAAEDKAGVIFGDIRPQESFKDFAASAPGQAWIHTHATDNATPLPLPTPPSSTPGTPATPSARQ